MPIIFPKPEAAPAPAPAEPMAAPQPAGVTREQVEQMLAARDALWSKHLDAMTKALLAAMPAAPPPRKPTKVKFETDARGYPVSFTITPEN